jgi:hypothetical protein
MPNKQKEQQVWDQKLMQGLTKLTPLLDVGTGLLIKVKTQKYSWTVSAGQKL